MPYTIAKPPFARNLVEMPKKELKQYFQWFMDALPQRVAELARTVRETPGFGSWRPDRTPDSLDALGDWFAGQVEARSPEEVQKAKDSLAFPMDFPSAELTDRTFSLAMDMGMYFSQILLKNYPALRWKQPLNDKKSADYGQPVLVKFTSAPFNPARLMVLLASSIVRKERTGSDLRELYNIWSKLVQPESAFVMANLLKLDDPELAAHCDRVLSSMVTFPKEARPICALMNAYDLFLVTDGEQSAPVREVIRRLRDPKLRPTLETWYLWATRPGPEADQLRRTLDRILGETPPLRSPAAEKVAQAIALIQSEGGEVLANEITLDAGGVRVRPDLFVRNADGSYSFVEVQTGGRRALATHARVSQIIRRGGAVPVGNNALESDALIPGVPMAPTPVRVIVFP